jgi:hypothetical protein
MAGLNVGGFGNYPGMPQNTRRAIPQEAQPAPSQGIDASPSTSPTPKIPKPDMNMGGGINVGRTSGMGILPSAQDPYRTYGTVSGGRMTPPQNPYGQNQPIRFTPGGEWGGGGPGPINSGPSPNMPPPNTGGGGGYYQPGQMPIPPPSTPGPRDYNMGKPLIPSDSYLPGGVTGNIPGPGNVPIQTGPSVPPPNPYMERGGFTGGGMPPDIGSETSGASTGYYQPPSMIPNMSPMDTPRGRGGLGQMYGGAGPSLSGSFKRGLFY